MRPVLFDTDIGSDCDDAVALGLVLAAPEALDLVAVTTVSAKPRRRAEIAAALLGLAGRAGCDVCVGEAGGLTRPPERYNWFGHEDQCVAAATPVPISEEAAPERIVRWLRRDDLERLEASGPLARELARHVRLWEPVQREVFTRMGGTLAPDNVSFLHDPLTVLALVDPAPLRFETLRILPTIESGILRTLEMPAGVAGGAAMRVATYVGAAAARDAIVERLLAL